MDILKISMLFIILLKINFILSIINHLKINRMIKETIKIKETLLNSNK